MVTVATESEGRLGMVVWDVRCVLVVRGRPWLCLFRDPKGYTRYGVSWDNTLLLLRRYGNLAVHATHSMQVYFEQEPPNMPLQYPAKEHLYRRQSRVHH